MADSDLDRIVSGTGIVFIGILISKILAYLYRLIIARMGVNEYGLFSLGLGIIGITSSFTFFGLHRGVLRYVSYYRGKEDYERVKGVIVSALKITFTISLIVAILLFLLSDFISLNYFYNINLSLILKILSISIPINVLNEILINAILGFQKVKYMVISKNIVLNSIRFLFTIIFLYFSVSIIGVTVIYVVSFFISLIFSFYFLEKKVFPIIKSKIKSVYQNRELFSFSWPLVFSGFALLIITWTDTIMLGALKTVREVGMYNAALPTSYMLYTVPQGLAFLVVPTLTYLFSKKEMNEFRLVYRTVTKWLFMFNLILLSLFILFSKEIISVLFGVEYSLAGDVLIILSIGLFINYFLIFTGYVPIISNKTKLDLFNLSTGAILNIILNILLIPKYSIIGAAIATSISFIVISVLYFIESIYIININPLKLSYIRIIVSILITSLLIKYFSVNFLKVDNIMSLIIISVLFLILYSIILILTKSFEKEDMDVIANIQRKTGLRIPFINNLIKKFYK